MSDGRDAVTDDAPANPAGDRDPGNAGSGGGANPLAQWLLLGGNRLLVTASLLGAVALALVLVATLGPDSLGRALYTDDTIDWLFQSLLGAIITGVTLVVTINQLVIAQELGAVGDQRQRMEEAMQFREDAEAYLETDVSPARPGRFFRSLLSAVREECSELSSLVSGGTDQSVRTEVTEFTRAVSDETERVESALEASEFGSFDLLGPLLEFEYSVRIHDARRLRTVHEEALGPEALDRLETIRDSLELFGAAREHVKTLYFQWELIELSRRMLYASIPALLVAVSTLLFVEHPGQIPGTTLGIRHGLAFVSLATAVALAPFLLLVSYVFRIATVTRRTLAIGPFVLGGPERD